MTDEKTRVERLADVMDEVNIRGDWVELSESRLVLDGAWSREPLEAALAAEFPDQGPPTGLVIATTEHDPATLFLREVWLSGEAEDGTKVELERSMATLIFRMTKPDGTVILHSIHAGDLLQKWANWVEK